MIRDLLAKLPERFQWTLHNCVAHPLHEMLFQLGMRNWAHRVHDATVPPEAWEPVESQVR